MRVMTLKILWGDASRRTAALDAIWREINTRYLFQYYWNATQYHTNLGLILSASQQPTTDHPSRLPLLNTYKASICLLFRYTYTNDTAPSRKCNTSFYSFYEPIFQSWWNLFIASFCTMSYKTDRSINYLWTLFLLTRCF